MPTDCTPAEYVPKTFNLLLRPEDRDRLERVRRDLGAHSWAEAVRLLLMKATESSPTPTVMEPVTVPRGRPRGRIGTKRHDPTPPAESPPASSQSFGERFVELDGEARR